MSSEAGTKTGVLSSIRKLLGGNDTEIHEPETGIDAGNDDPTLVLTTESEEVRGVGAPAKPNGADVIDVGYGDGDALVLGSTMLTQVPNDPATLSLMDDDIKDNDPLISFDDAVVSEAEPTKTHGDVSEDAGSALLDIGLEDAGPSPVDFNDDFEPDRLAGGADVDDLFPDGDDRQDYDPTVWSPVLPIARDGSDAGDADASAATLDDDPPEEVAEDLATQVGDDNLEETSVSEQSEEDEVDESVDENEGEAQDEALTGEPDEAAADGPEDFQELLEDTVRRIVREELSGDMGQRLSQNIRKMIRDHVAQMLPARD